MGKGCNGKAFWKFDGKGSPKMPYNLKFTRTFSKRMKKTKLENG